MNKQTLIWGAIAAGVGLVVWDSLKVKRHWYLPVEIDAQYVVANAIRKGYLTIQAGDAMLLNMRTGDSTPLGVIAALESLENMR